MDGGSAVDQDSDVNSLVLVEKTEGGGGGVLLWRVMLSCTVSRYCISQFNQGSGESSRMLGGV